MPINLDVEHVRRHKSQLTHFFDYFSVSNAQDIQTPLLAYMLQPSQFDNYGTLWFSQNNLDAKSLRLVQTIEDSYMATSFFSSRRQGKIGSRGSVYYSSAIIDDDEARSLFRFLNHNVISVQLLRELYPTYMNHWEFGIYALLDDIRYKLLILEDYYPEIVNEGHGLLSTAISLFYDYLQGTMPDRLTIHAFCEQLQAALFLALRNIQPGTLRTYKEADHPYQNLVFRETLLNRLGLATIDTVVGIRFGGTELPHLVERQLGAADVKKVRISKYSGDQSQIGLTDKDCRNKSILILDDNVLSGRTLDQLVTFIKQKGALRAYFGCVTYSSMKRYHQMIMEGHGVVNPEVLLNSCVVGESQYTKITNSRSYKNSNGVFDKVKDGLQKRMSGSQYIGYRL
jgi:phosphoribosylpyrophosphate synthetase